jgi:DNA uptake protein ComE-like DNA-binding protein
MGRLKTVVGGAVAALVLGGTLYAQTAPLPPLVDPNTATEKELTAVPHITPAIAKGILSRRPFATVTDLDNYLKEQKLTPEQLTEVYGKLFVRIKLNSATDDEILKIPGIGQRMLREFKEYRPYKSVEQFRKEIGKYIPSERRADELARLERYILIQ